MDLSKAREEYAAFEEKVRRTVYLDNMSHQVTASVIKTAMDQFGAVKNVQFIPNYIGPKNMPQCALVEMETEKQAEAVITTLFEYPFMMSGIPRPVRARAAELSMFEDRPAKPGRPKIEVKWLDASDPAFETAKEIKRVVKRHAAEVNYLVEKQLESEEILAKQQAETLKANYKKFEIIDKITSEESARALARRYNLRIGDE
ncbi:hypothetical protein ACFE04_006481 [Oxalis oulophora]